LYSFLHLAVHFEGSQSPDRNAIELVLNRAKDWYRYTPNCWLILTSKDAETWYKRLNDDVPGMRNHTSFFICEVNIRNRAGWIRQEVWDWIAKSRKLITQQS
jgi:hypothetical protein